MGANGRDVHSQLLDDGDDHDRQRFSSRSPRARDEPVAVSAPPGLPPRSSEDSSMGSIDQLVEGIAKLQKVLLPKEVIQKVAQETKTLEEKLLTHLKSIDKKKKLEEWKSMYDVGKYPAGMPRFAAPEWGVDMDEAFLPSALNDYEYTLEIPRGKTVRQALELAFCNHQWIKADIEYQMHVHRQARLKPLLNAADYLERCQRHFRPVEDYEDLELELDNVLLDIAKSDKQEEALKDLGLKSYKALLSRVKERRALDEKQKEKEERGRVKIEENAGKLKPQDMIKGVVRQVLAEDAVSKKDPKERKKFQLEQAKLQNDKYHFDFIEKYAGEEATVQSSVLPKQEQQRTRKWTKKELAQRKVRDAKNEWPGNSEPQSSPKGKGKKGKGKGTGKTQKGKSKGKGKESPQQPNADSKGGKNGSKGGKGAKGKSKGKGKAKAQW